MNHAKKLALPDTSITDGLSSTYRAEGIRGLYRGTTLALVGVSNGAIQFMGYEQMKWFCTEQKRRQFRLSGREWTPDSEKLVRWSEYISSTLLFANLVGAVQFDVYRALRSLEDFSAVCNLSLPGSALAYPKQRNKPPLSDDTFLHRTNLEGGRVRWVLQGTWNEPCACPAWDLRHIRGL